MKTVKNQYREIMLYCIFGCFTFLVDTGLFLLFSFLFDLEENLWLMHICNIIAVLAAITFAYFTNRKYVFENKGKSRKEEMTEFYSARLFTLILSEVFLQITVGSWSFSVRWMKILINIIVIALNYVFSKFWIFTGKKKKLCTFDLDGTLVNSIYDIAGAVNRSLEKMGKKTHKIEEYYRFVGDGMIMLCRRALPDGTEEEVNTLIQLYQEDYLKNCCVETVPYDGVPAMLEELKKSGMQLAIITNKPQSQTEEVVDKLLGKEYFSFIIGSGGEYPCKPDTTALETIEKELNIKKDEVWHIGDSDVDMRLGVNAGVSALGAVWGFRSEEELKGAGATAILHNIPELMVI